MAFVVTIYIVIVDILAHTTGATFDSETNCNIYTAVAGSVGGCGAGQAAEMAGSSAIGLARDFNEICLADTLVIGIYFSISVVVT